MRIDAGQQQQRVVIFSHVPIHEKASSLFHLLWSHLSVRQMPATHECVCAWCNGHDRKGSYAEDDEVHYLTFAGMVEAFERNAFTLVHAFRGQLVIEGIGKQASLTLQVPASAKTSKR